MPSSTAKQPNYGRRILWLTIILLVLFGGYTAGWYWLAGRIQGEVETRVARLNGDGVKAECLNARVEGYPMRIGLTCDGIDYQDDAHGVAASVGRLQTAAQALQPLLTVAQLDGPLRTQAPGTPPLWIDWDDLKASVRLWHPLPDRVSVQIEGLSVQTDPEDGDPVFLFNAAQTEGHLRPNGNDLDWAGSFNGLEIDQNILGQRNLPPLDGESDLTLADGVPLLLQRASGPEALRGKSGTIRQLKLAAEGASISLTGPFSFDAEGYLDAQLTLSWQNTQKLGDVLAGAFPEQGNNIRNILTAIAAAGQSKAPVSIKKGRVGFSFFTLGQIPPI